MRSASEFPEPNTTWVRPWLSTHFVQPATWSAKAVSARLRDWASSTRGQSKPHAGRSEVAFRLVAAAAGAAAATAARGAGLRAACYGRERRELLRDLRRAAPRAGDLLIAADELFEVLLALHAHVLVHRHGAGKFSTCPSPDDRRACRSRSSCRSATSRRRRRD